MKQPILILIASLALSFSVNQSLAEDWQSAMAQAKSDLKDGKLDDAEDGFTKAQKLLEEAKTSTKDELKANGMALVDCIVGISKVKDKRGDDAGAEQAYEMAMNTLKNFCEGGIKSQQFADYIPGIAELYERHGKISQADLALQRVLELRKTVPPIDNNKTISAYDLYARFLRRQKRNDEATIIENSSSQLRQYISN